MSFENLPLELVEGITNFLSLKDLFKLSITNGTFFKSLAYLRREHREYIQHNLKTFNYVVLEGDIQCPTDKSVQAFTVDRMEEPPYTCDNFKVSYNGKQYNLLTEETSLHLYGSEEILSYKIYSKLTCDDGKVVVFGLDCSSITDEKNSHILFSSNGELKIFKVDLGSTDSFSISLLGCHKNQLFIRCYYSLEENWLAHHNSIVALNTDDGTFKTLKFIPASTIHRMADIISHFLFSIYDDYGFIQLKTVGSCYSKLSVVDLKTLELVCDDIALKTFERVVWDNDCLWVKEFSCNWVCKDFKHLPEDVPQNNNSFT